MRFLGCYLNVDLLVDLLLGYCVYFVAFSSVCLRIDYFGCVLFAVDLLILIYSVVLLCILDFGGWNCAYGFAGLGFDCFAFTVFAVSCCLTLVVLIWLDLVFA